MIMIIMVIYSRTHRYLVLFPIPCAFFISLLLHGRLLQPMIHVTAYALMLPGLPPLDSVFLEVACGKDDFL